MKLGHRQRSVIGVLTRARCALTEREIAEALGFWHSTSRVRPVLASLRRRGLIERAPAGPGGEPLWRARPDHSWYPVSGYCGVSIVAPLRDEDVLVAVDATKLAPETLDRAADAAERGIRKIEISREEYLRAAGFEGQW
jgi:hypothetical protein